MASKSAAASGWVRSMSPISAANVGVTGHTVMLMIASCGVELSRLYTLAAMHPTPGATRLGKVHTLLLLAPLAVVAGFGLFTFSVMAFNPAAGVSERGDEGLLYASLFASVVEIAAVPAAVVRMWRSPALRRGGNVLLVLAGVIPVAACALLWLALLLGLG